MISKEKILVTGAGGFTGGVVVRLLLKEGRSVRAMVRNEADATALRELGAEVVFGDLTQPESLSDAVKGCTAVFHIAALFRQAGLPESEFIRVNVDGTKHLLEASERFGIKRFIHCSTVGVHGDIEDPPASEDYRYAPGDMYQRSKVAAEEIVFSFFKENRIKGVIIRPAMIYGPQDSRTRKLFQMVSRGKFFYVGKGEALVHFIDVRDLARAFILALDRGDIHNRAYIIAGSEAMPLKKLVDRVCTILEVKSPTLHLPVRPMQILGDICELICTPLRITPPLYRRRVDFFTKSRHFDCSRAFNELGFSPSQDSYGELIDILNSYVEQGAIEGRLLSEPCTIHRTREGKIMVWDNKAEHFYGFLEPEALGQITHSLLKTKFPLKLEDINHIFRKDGQWSGNLSHASRSDENISVFSRWKLPAEVHGDERIIEENRIRISREGKPGSWPTSNSFVLAALASHEPLLTPLVV